MVAYDRSDKSHMYIDGVLQTDEDTISGIGDISNAERFTLGANRSGTESWDGSKSTIIIIKDADLSSLMTAAFAQQVAEWAGLA